MTINFVKLKAIIITGLFSLMACGQDTAPHLAPIYHDPMLVMACGKKNWEQHIPYLYHLAEIQRRVESCPIVTRLSIQTMRSTPENPILRAGCGYTNESGKMKYFATDYSFDEVKQGYNISMVRQDEPGIAPVASYAKFHTGNCEAQYSGNIPYLYHVAELARRQSDCYLLTDIDIKGKSRYKPRFEATCEDKIGDEFVTKYGRKEVREKYAEIFNLSSSYWGAEGKYE